jgi:nitric oxide reductase NorE protein
VEGVWVFVAADMTMFAMLFVSFMLDRRHAPALFENSRHALNADFGGVNTLILLTSSWLVVLAVDAAKAGRVQQVPRCLAGAWACGLAFCVSKALEYGGKLHAGISMLSNDFYMYYFALTGIHLLHVVAGTVMLGVLWKKARAGAYGAANRVGLECGATYWHMVDLLWILLFPLLYLARQG